MERRPVQPADLMSVVARDRWARRRESPTRPARRAESDETPLAGLPRQSAPTTHQLLSCGSAAGIRRLGVSPAVLSGAYQFDYIGIAVVPLC